MVKEIVERITGNARKGGRQALLEPEAKEICVAYGIPTPKFRVAQSVLEATSLAEEVTYPTVLKIVSPDILHKTEAGGVIVGLNTKEHVKEAYNQILSNVKQHDPKPRVEGVLV